MSNHHHNHHHQQQCPQCPYYPNYCQCRPAHTSKSSRSKTKFPPTPIKTRGGGGQNRISTTFGGSGSISGGSTSSFSTTSTPSTTGSPLSPLVETFSYSPSLLSHMMPSTSPPHPLDRSPANAPPKLSTPITTTTNSSVASPIRPPNPLKSGTFGLDLFGIQAASHNTPLEYFPPFDPNANVVPPTSPLSPLNRDDNDIIRNKQKHVNNTDNDSSNDYDNNNNDNRDNNNDENIASRSNSISFPSRKERHTFGYDDHHHGPPSFLDLPSSPGDFEYIHPLDSSPYLESPPSPLHPPTSLYTTPPSQPRPLSPPPKNIKRPVVSPTFVHDQHLSEITPTPTSSYKPSIAHRNHSNHHHNSNNKHAHGTHSTPRINNRCSMNMTNNNNLTSSPNTASDKKPKSKSAHPKRRFSFFANAFSNSTAPMTTNTSPHSSASSLEDRHQHHHSHPRYDALVLSSLQARPSTSLSHRISHNTLSSQTDPDFLSSAPVSSKKHISISSSTSPRSRPCSPPTPVDMALSPPSLVAPSSQGGLTVQVQDHWRWSNASTRAIYDRSDVRDSCGGGDASTYPEGQSAMFVSPSLPTSPSSSVYLGSVRPYAVYYGSGSQESLVIETLSHQQQQQVTPGAGVMEKTEAKQGHLESSSTVVEKIGDMTKMHGKESSPPPSSPRPSSLPQDRVAKKRRKGLSIFCFFLKR